MKDHCAQEAGDVKRHVSPNRATGGTSDPGHLFAPTQNIGHTRNIFQHRGRTLECGPTKAECGSKGLVLAEETVDEMQALESSNNDRNQHKSTRIEITKPHDIIISHPPLRLTTCSSMDACKLSISAIKINSKQQHIVGGIGLGDSYHHGAGGD
ncbi:predicted protein [Histoplasma capsulatum H143]|uniref:Uncharacterized protein n=1 Tax=Ajellomyces capsulatus (strain H143) TaxID=544712 RepID=C6H8R9_AJECH|nr:predicted protein [Histoplasma capsulatum H143]